MLNGRTIAAERERPMADSERMQERKKQRKRKIATFLLVVAAVLLLVWLLISGVAGLIEALKVNGTNGGAPSTAAYAVKADIVDETGAGVTSSMKIFISQVEADLGEYGYELLRAVLPEGKMREVDLYLAGREGYIKVRSDRAAGEQAEDIDRMLRYLGDREFEYVDVRVEGKGYFK